MRVPVIAAIVGAAAAGAGAQSLILLPHVPSTSPNATAFGLATGSSFDGSVLAATCGVDGPWGGPVGFSWTQELGSAALPRPAGFAFTVASDMSADASVVVGYVWGSSQHRGAVWVNGSAAVLPTLPGAESAELLAVSADGSVALGISFFGAAGSAYFRWAASGELRPIEGLPPAATLRALNTDGTRIVGKAGGRAIVWSENGDCQDLPFPPGTSASEAWDITPDARVIVGRADDPARWTAAGGVLLPLPPGWSSGTARGVSDDGFVIAGVGSSGLQQAGYIWTPALSGRDLKQLLQSSGVPVSAEWMEVVGVSGDGRTVFGALHQPQSEFQQAFAARLRPEWVCYANCDGSMGTPALTVSDFTCFLQRFAAGDFYADCDNSATAPALSIADFTCFLQKFAAGCE